jgi:predicted phosphodiesterase
MLEKRKDESNLEFHKRLVYGKLVDKTLADIDYSELAPMLYGQDYAGDNARKMMYGSLKTLQLMDEEGIQAYAGGNTDVLDNIEMKRLELKKEQQKFYDQRNALSKLIRERSRQEELNDIITSTVNSGNLPQLTYEPGLVSYSERDLLVSLNDIHYGANINNYWHQYNSDICREMFEKYLARIIKIANETDVENCIIWCNGDQISGNIHYSIAVSNKENVIEQIIGVSELIAHFIAELSKYFNTVKFVSVPGNHSRINPNKDMAINGERLDDLVEWYLKARLQTFENVEIGAGIRVDPTIYMIDIRGKTYVGVHGDFDGSDAKVQALQTMVRRPVYAVLSGHLHHNKVDCVQGIKTVMAGSFLGMDDYCVSKRIYGAPEQLVCVVSEDGIECTYDVAL